MPSYVQTEDNGATYKEKKWGFGSSKPHILEVFLINLDKPLNL